LKEHKDVSKQLRFWIDLVVVFVAFVGMVFGIVALTGQVHWPWPVTAVRMTINAVITLILAWKVVEYLRAHQMFDGTNAETRNGLIGILVIALIVIVALFFLQHMGALSALFLIAFCALGYLDRLPEKQQEKSKKPAQQS
jgi:flagellar basal body-associated protein FliL